MKKFSFTMLVLVTSFILNGQSSLNVVPGIDMYSNYIFRGSKFGTGPSMQPYINMEYNNFTLGAWGSFDAAGYAEADLYASYTFPFGLTIIATDYYYPDQKHFDFSDTTGSHAFEGGLSYSLGKLTASGYYIFNKAGGAGSIGSDKYFELSYKLENVSFFVGAGDGWHTSDTKFAICNVGVKATKEIKVTETFSIPTTGLVIFNPEKEVFTIVVGISF